MNKQQTITTKRISNYLDDNREMYHDFASCFVKVYKQESFDDEGYYTGDVYVMSTYPNDMMPATHSESFDTVEALAEQMKKETGDLRTWKVIPYEWYN